MNQLLRPFPILIAFLTLSISRLLHTFNMRGADSGFFDNEIVKNIYVWGAIFLSLALLVLAVYWAPLAGILELTALGTSGWLLVLGASAITFVVGQLYITLFKSK